MGKAVGSVKGSAVGKGERPKQRGARAITAEYLGKTKAPDQFTEHVRLKFLALLAQGRTISACCLAVNVSTTTFYRHKNGNPEFAAQVAQAEIDGVQFMEDEARRRGVDGVDDPVVYQGNLSYHTDPRTGELLLDADGKPIPLTVKKYSDNLLMFTLKARDRARYADRHELTGADGGPIETQDLAAVSQAVRGRIQGMLRRITVEETITRRVAVEE